MPDHRRISDSAPLRWVDRLADFCGSIGVYMLIFVTVVLTYEAFARYAFSAPTQWTQDISTTLQIWFTYIGMAMLLREGRMIRITAILVISPRWLLYVLEALALLVVLVFSLIAVVKGWDMLGDSIRLGRRQPTMLALPNWISELPIVAGFLLLAVEAVAELVRLPFRGPPVFRPDGEVVLPGSEKSESEHAEVRP